MRVLWVLLLAAAGAVLHAAPPHVVLISIDTLRADHLSTYGYGRQTSPFLEARAKEGLVFERVIVPLPATTPSHGSLLTGVHPFVHGALSNAASLSPRVDMLASAMKRRGYSTAAAVSAFHLGASYGFRTGFDHFSEPVAAETTPLRAEARTGVATNSAALALVDRARRAQPRKPLFLFVHYFDLHAPYGWWKPGLTDPWNEAERVARYDESIRHVDGLIAQLTAALRARGIEDVLYVVTSDHGEQLGERGLSFGHADLYTETTDVPLIMWGRGVPNRRIARPISSLEIGPAIATAAGATLRNGVPKPNTISETLETTIFGQLAALVSGEKPPQPVLVSGYPLYTRSVMLANGRYRFIRNFDHVYRYAAASVAPAKPEGQEQQPAGVREDALRFRVPTTAYDPHVITFDHHPRAKGCAVTAVVEVDGEPYFTTPIAARERTRVQFAAARLDVIDVFLAPARCAGKVFTSIARLERPDQLSTSGQSIVPPLFANLLVVRKTETADELYDLESDPNMMRNRIADAELRETAVSMRRQLRETFMQLAASRTRHLQRARTPEEVKKLKSLGYIQ